MSDLANLLNKVIASLGDKCGAESKKEKFNTEIRLNFDQDLPIKPGMAKGAEDKGLVWESPMWASADLVDGYQRSFPQEFKKELSENDAKILLNLVESVSGDMNLREDTKQVHSLYKKLYGDEIRSERSSQGNTEKVQNILDEIKSFWDKLQKSNASAINSREKALEDLKNKAFFDDEIAKKVKSTFLRFTTPDKIVRQVKRMMGEDIGKKNYEKPEEAPKAPTIKNPTLDKDKQKFTRDDRDWVMNLIYENQDAGGTKGIIKKMKKHFNLNMINEAQLASDNAGGDLKKFYDYFYNYTRNAPKLERSLTDKMTLPEGTSKGELTAPVANVLKYLDGIKKKMGAEYKNSLYEKTEELIRLIQRYNTSKKRDRRLERALLEGFQANILEPDLPPEDGEEAPKDDPKAVKGIGKAWTRLRTPVTKDVKLIQKLLSEWSEREETSGGHAEDAAAIKELEKETDAQNQKELGNSDLGRKILKLLEETPELTDKEKNVMKDKKKDQRKDIKDLSNQNKDKTFRFSISSLEDHLDRVKKSFGEKWSNGTIPLYRDTAKFVDMVKKYSKGPLNTVTTPYLRDILANDLIPNWRVVADPTVLKFLKKLRASFNDVLKDPSKEKNEDNLDKDLFKEIESLGESNRTIKDDGEVADVLHPKKQKKKTEEVKDIPVEDSKKSTSKTSTQYRGTIQGRIEKIAQYATDPLIKEELRSILYSIQQNT